ncbi:hypothetical protein PPYR_06393 [Photinus pyralis]|uniref:Uncharacterized protein n=1 Tax=Photinus pyralis TaxID=7054 RepID=A0A5N4ATI2_PHOPY|nr:hypothetical protein PPYR_06393 [Photinus pyralis]
MQNPNIISKSTTKRVNDKVTTYTDRAGMNADNGIRPSIQNEKSPVVKIPTDDNNEHEGEWKTIKTTRRLRRKSPVRGTNSSNLDIQGIPRLYHLYVSRLHPSLSAVNIII